MTKKNILSIILDSIFVVAFNILFFVNGGISHSVSIWLCYGFLHFAYLMLLLTPVFETKEYLSKLSTYGISFSYFLIEIFFTSFVIFYKSQNGENLEIKIVISVQIVLTAIYLIILITNLLANDSTVNKQAKHNIQTEFIKTISAKAKFIESIAYDSKLKNHVNNLYYTIYSSPIRSSTEVSVLEESIVDLLNKLEDSMSKNNEEEANKLITEIERLVNKRNFMLKARN